MYKYFISNVLSVMLFLSFFYYLNGAKLSHRILRDSRSNVHACNKHVPT